MSLKAIFGVEINVIYLMTLHTAFIYNTTPTKKYWPLIGCLAVYFSLIPVQLINSTVIRELSTINFFRELIPGIVSGILYPGTYIRGLYPGVYISPRLISRGIYPGGLYPGA